MQDARDPLENTASAARKFTIRIDGGARPFECDREETVLYAMRMADLRDLEFKCRAGGCGTCRAQVLEGRYATGAMSDEQIGGDDLARNIVLACQLYPRSDLLVRPYRRAIEGLLDEAPATRLQSTGAHEGAHVPARREEP